MNELWIADNDIFESKEIVGTKDLISKENLLKSFDEKIDVVESSLDDMKTELENYGGVFDGYEMKSFPTECPAGAKLDLASNRNTINTCNKKISELERWFEEMKPGLEHYGAVFDGYEMTQAPNQAPSSFSEMIKYTAAVSSAAVYKKKYDEEYLPLLEKKQTAINVCAAVYQKQYTEEYTVLIDKKDDADNNFNEEKQRLYAEATFSYGRDYTKITKYGFILSEIEIGVPEPNVTYTVIPGRNSPIRFKSVPGKLSFNPRQIKFTLSFAGAQLGKELYLNESNATDKMLSAILSSAIEGFGLAFNMTEDAEQKQMQLYGVRQKAIDAIQESLIFPDIDKYNLDRSRKSFNYCLSRFVKDFAGKTCRFAISDDPMWAYVGTPKIESSYDSLTEKGTITLTVEDGDAFRYSDRIIVEIKHSSDGIWTFRQFNGFVNDSFTTQNGSEDEQSAFFTGYNLNGDDDSQNDTSFSELRMDGIDEWEAREKCPWFDLTINGDSQGAYEREKFSSLVGVEWESGDVFMHSHQMVRLTLPSTDMTTYPKMAVWQNGASVRLDWFNNGSLHTAVFDAHTPKSLNSFWIQGGENLFMISIPNSLDDKDVTLYFCFERASF